MHDTGARAVVRAGVQVLLDAAALYESRSQAQPERLPRLVLVITGKGPQKAAYLQQLAGLAFERIALRTAWLQAPDYPSLLACADLGVSLHASSSDLDLPMKVADMLGWCAVQRAQHATSLVVAQRRCKVCMHHAILLHRVAPPPGHCPRTHKPLAWLQSLAGCGRTALRLPLGCLGAPPHATLSSVVAVQWHAGVRDGVLVCA